MKSIIIDHASLSDRVFEALRDAISQKDLVPGTLYSVAAISEQLGVSRTPVREALLLLAANGVVEFKPNRGVEILPVTVTDLEEIYKLRLLLEVPCAYQAASVITEKQMVTLIAAYSGMKKCAAKNDIKGFDRYDIDFHNAILIAGGNHRIIEAVRVTREQMYAKGFSTTPTRTLEQILEPHTMIYEAIASRNPEAAALASQKHLLASLEILVNQFGSDDEKTSYQQPFSAWVQNIESALNKQPNHPAT